jgi:peptide/nickel transport system permease protein
MPAPVEPGAYDAATAAVPDRPRTLWRDAWGQMRRSRVALLCGAVLLLYVLVGLVGFTGVLSDEKVVDGATIPGLIERTIGKSHQPPTLRNPTTGAISPSYWIGLDFMGRSVFWRLVYGTRVALTVALLASIIEIIMGFSLGALAGYFGGIVDAIITWLFSTVASVPWILLMISFAYVLKNRTLWGYELTGIPSIVLALGLTTWVGLCRLIRGEVLKHRDRDYVVAARAMGLGHGRIVFRHILPNVFHLVIINFALGLAMFVHAEVILSFLGLGVTEVPSWGRMIDDAKLELLKGVWWPLLASTVAIFIFSLAVNLFGDALRDALDPRLRGTD